MSNTINTLADTIAAGEAQMGVSWPNPWWPSGNPDYSDCAAFVSWLLFGLDANGEPQQTLVSGVIERSGLEFHSGANGILAGDVIGFLWPADIGDNYSHTELAITDADGNGNFQTIGTNSTPDCIAIRNRNSSYVVAYARPSYVGGPAAAPAAANPWDDVAAIQTRLCAWGITVAIDGVPGPETTGGIETFQAQHGLTIDGLVGPETWPVLTSPSPAEVGASTPAPVPVAPDPAPNDPAPTPTPEPAPAPTSTVDQAAPAAEPTTPVAPTAEPTAPAPQPKEQLMTTQLTPEQLDQLSQFNTETAGGASRFTLFSKDFWTYSLERVIKSVTYTASAQLVGVGGALIVNPEVSNALAAIGWGYLVTTSLLAGLASLLVSLSSFKNIK